MESIQGMVLAAIGDLRAAKGFFSGGSDHRPTAVPRPPYFR